MKRRFYIERSEDGKVLYFRPGPGKRWDMMVDQHSGSQYMFQELERGEGAWYTIASVRPDPLKR